MQQNLPARPRRPIRKFYGRHKSFSFKAVLISVPIPASQDRTVIVLSSQLLPGHRHRANIENHWSLNVVRNVVC